MATEKNITMKQYNGTDYDTLYPKTTMNQIIGITARLNQLEFIQKYITAGSYTWTCPEDGEYVAVIIGGGGAGAVNISTSGNGVTASGGGSGYVEYVQQQITANTQVAIVVGAGGNNTAGGSSSFNGVTAEGGSKGASGGSTGSIAVEGGQYSAGGQGLAANTSPCFGGVPVFNRADDSNIEILYSGSIAPIGFVDEKGLPISMMCAGGSGDYYYPQSKDVTLPNGKTLSPAVGSHSAVSGDNFTTVTPTDCGAGSGGIAVHNSSSTSGITGTAGNGAPGGVFIYKVGGASA